MPQADLAIYSLSASPPINCCGLSYLIVAMDLPSVPVAELRGHNGPIHIVRFTGELCFGVWCNGGEFYTSYTCTQSHVSFIVFVTIITQTPLMFMFM